MIILDYQEKYQKIFMHAINLALKDGKVIAFPTETSYGLAVDASNLKAIKRLYKIKGREFNKPISLIFPTQFGVEQWVRINSQAKKIIKQFWPGAVTLVLPIKTKTELTKLLTANSDQLGVRISPNQIAKAMTQNLGQPITATSANVSNQIDCYSADEILKQYHNRKEKPDIIINVGKLPKRKASTVVRISEQGYEILRLGPITKKQIETALSKN